jgi:hypothetical protein
MSKFEKAPHPNPLPEVEGETRLNELIILNDSNWKS